MRFLSLKLYLLLSYTSPQKLCLAWEEMAIFGGSNPPVASMNSYNFTYLLTYACQMGNSVTAGAEVAEW